MVSILTGRHSNPLTISARTDSSWGHFPPSSAEHCQLSASARTKCGCQVQKLTIGRTRINVDAARVVCLASLGGVLEGESILPSATEYVLAPRTRLGEALRCACGSAILCAEARYDCAGRSRVAAGSILNRLFGNTIYPQRQQTSFRQLTERLRSGSWPMTGRIQGPVILRMTRFGTRALSQFTRLLAESPYGAAGEVMSPWSSVSKAFPAEKGVRRTQQQRRKS